VEVFSSQSLHSANKRGSPWHERSEKGFFLARVFGERGTARNRIPGVARSKQWELWNSAGALGTGRIRPFAPRSSKAGGEHVPTLSTENKERRFSAAQSFDRHGHFESLMRSRTPPYELNEPAATLLSEFQQLNRRCGRCQQKLRLFFYARTGDVYNSEIRISVVAR
jgi:hypothetical protein